MRIVWELGTGVEFKFTWHEILDKVRLGVRDWVGLELALWLEI